MISNIFYINDWANNTSYTKNSIVKYNNFYYYSVSDHTSSSAFSTDLSNGKWMGFVIINNESKPYFNWRPDYKYNIIVEPKVLSIQFGDGYTQDLQDGINNTLLKIDLTFSNRKYAEYSAILHFLHSRNGSEKFYFVPPAPYAISKKFVCLKWTPTQNFYDDYTISATFEERV